MIRNALLLGVFLALTGCSNPDKRLPYPIAVTQEGFGPLHADTPFEIGILRGKLPGFDIRALQQITPELPKSVLLLERNGHLVAEIYPDANGSLVSKVIISSPYVKNRSGIGIGDLLLETEEMRCNADLCHDSQEPSVAYRIEPQTYRITEIIYGKL